MVMGNNNRNLSEKNLGSASGGMDSASIGGYIQKGCIRVPNATEGYSEPIAYRVVDNNGNVSNIFGSLDSAK